MNTTSISSILIKCLSLKIDSFFVLPNLCFTLYKHAIELHKIFSNKEPPHDWLSLNFDHAINRQQTHVKTIKNQNFKVANNILRIVVHLTESRWPNEFDQMNTTEPWQRWTLLIEHDRNWNQWTLWNRQTLSFCLGSS